jgi:hypothetical protein
MFTVSALDWARLVAVGKDRGAGRRVVPRARASLRRRRKGRRGWTDADGIEVEAVERDMPATRPRRSACPGRSGRRIVGRSPPGETKRLAAIVAASQVVFDRVAAAAPESLRKGPRGGGRDRTKIVGHVNDPMAATHE